MVDSGFTLEMHFQNDNRAKAQRYTSHNPNMAFDTIMLYDRVNMKLFKSLLTWLKEKLARYSNWNQRAYPQRTESTYRRLWQPL